MGEEAIVYLDRSAVRPSQAALIDALAELAALVEAREYQIVAYKVAPVRVDPP